MKRLALAAVLPALVACSGPAELTCEQQCLMPIEAVDDVSWELDVFHVQICLDASCAEVDTMRGGPSVAVPLTGIDASVQMAIPASGHESELHLFLQDGALTTGEAVHVVVTQPGTGIEVCDMTAHVVAAPPSSCGCPVHTLDAWVANR